MRTREGRQDRAAAVWVRYLIMAAVMSLHGTLMAGCSWARTKPAAVPFAAAAGTAPQPSLEMRETLGLTRSRWPLSTGVPFPRGKLPDAAHLTLSDGSTPIPVQTRVLSRWPDGSVRWALLDWQADVKAKQSHRFRFDVGTPAAPTQTVKVRDAGDHLEVETGPLQFSVPKNRFAVLADVRLHGTPMLGGPLVSFFNVDGKRADAAAPTVTVTEAGPLRARIELRGRYAASFHYVVRIDAFAGQPFVRILHTFEQQSPETYSVVRQIGVEMPMKFDGPPTYRVGREKGKAFEGTLPAPGFTLVQADNEAFEAGEARVTGRAEGWADLRDATHGAAVAARYFWQEYPQSLQLRATGLTYNLWAPEAPPAKIGMGAAKTHEIVVLFHDKTAPSPTLLAAIAQPLPVRLDPSWVVASGALPHSLAPDAATSGFLHELHAAHLRYLAHADTERWDDSGHVRCPEPAQERPRTGFYGMLNWGDWNFPGYHDTTKGCDAWGNLEYDMTQVLALGYAASGEPAYYDGMVASARHFMDVDRIYFQNLRPSWVGMNHPKNPLHFAFDLGGVDLGHTWTEGLLSYYYLTGDDRGLDAARGIADFLVNRLRGLSLPGNPRQSGWPQIALVAVYEATGEARYKTAATEYARKGMSAHPPDKIADWKMGILAEALCDTHAVTQDAELKEWLVRYAATVKAHGAKLDARFVPAAAYVARLTGDASLAQAAAATVPRLKFGNWGKPFTIAGRLGFSILSPAAP